MKKPVVQSSWCHPSCSDGLKNQKMWSYSDLNDLSLLAAQRATYANKKRVSSL
jgi:hypothetical protein